MSGSWLQTRWSGVRTEELAKIQSIVPIVRSTATRKAIITLDNGQVRMQINYAKLCLSGYDKVAIRRANLGSYLLYKSGSKTSMRVKRISWRAALATKRALNTTKRCDRFRPTM
jgi:hypothetical protein